MTLKMSLALTVFSGAADRYAQNGYRDTPKLQERLSAASKLKGIKAVEIQQTDVTSDLSAKDLKRMLKEYGLACSAVSASLAHDRRFALAAFGHQHQKTRNAAIDEGRKAVDIAKELGIPDVTMRLYSDGFDRYDVPRRTGIERAELLSAARQIRDYFNNDVEYLTVRVVKRGVLYENLYNPPLYTADESAGFSRAVLHMRAFDSCYGSKCPRQSS